MISISTHLLQTDNTRNTHAHMRFSKYKNSTQGMAKYQQRRNVFLFFSKILFLSFFLSTFLPLQSLDFSLSGIYTTYSKWRVLREKIRFSFVVRLDNFSFYILNMLSTICLWQNDDNNNNRINNDLRQTIFMLLNHLPKLDCTFIYWAANNKKEIQLWEFYWTIFKNEG